MAIKKRNGPVTFEMLTEFYTEFIKPHFVTLEKKTDRNSKLILENKKAIKVNGVKIDKLDDQFDGLKEEFSTVPTRKEFFKLERKVKSLQVS